MVGSGIFTGPSSILLTVGNRKTAIGLWVVGFAWTILCMFLYLEYARKLPYTGGELIYLDVVIPSWPLLSYTIYSFYFILTYTTTTNALQFGRQVIIAAKVTEDPNFNFLNDVDLRVWRLIAVAILSLVCLLVYFSPRWSKHLNTILAGLKIGVLLVLLVAGAIKAKNNGNLINDQQTKNNGDILPSATAVLTALFSFQGWENATLVSGEIKNHATLRRGFISGVLLVGVLYILIAIVYSCGIPWNSNGGLDSEFAAQLFDGNGHAEQAWAIIIALSAVGSMLSVTYTCSRVKQVITWANIIPWSTFWRRSTFNGHVASDGRSRDGGQEGSVESENESENDIENIMVSKPPESPEGGIVLHWIVSTAYICISAAIIDTSEAIGLSGRLVSYGSMCVNVVLAIMYHKVAAMPPDRYEIVALNWNPGKETLLLRRPLGRWILTLLIGLGGMALLIVIAMSENSNPQLPGWMYLAINAGVALSGFFYWICFLNCSKSKTGTSLMRLGNATPQLTEHGVSNADTARRCALCTSQQYRGQAHRHLTYGYINYISIEHTQGFWFSDILYWFFGGTRGPGNIAKDVQQRLKGWFRSKPVNNLGS